MTALFNRWLPAATLATWSLILLHLARPYGELGRWLGANTPFFTGRVSSLLDRPFWMPMFLAAVVLMVLALLFAVFKVDSACCSASECGHPLSRFAAGRWLTFLILVLPVTLAARYSPETLSASYTEEAVRSQGVATDISQVPGLAAKVERRAEKAASSAPAAAAPAPAAVAPAPSVDPLASTLPLPQADPAAAPAPAAAEPSTNALESYVQKTPEGYLEAEVLDLLYAAQDNTLRKVFEGRTVQLVGQLMPDPAEATPGKQRIKAVRMFMTCCAADARPVATSVEVKEAPKLPEMTWIKIVGKATFPVENGRRAALLEAVSIEKTEPPPDSMLY